MVLSAAEQLNVPTTLIVNLHNTRTQNERQREQITKEQQRYRNEKRKQNTTTKAEGALADSGGLRHAHHNGHIEIGGCQHLGARGPADAGAVADEQSGDRGWTVERWRHPCTMHHNQQHTNSTKCNHKTKAHEQNTSKQKQNTRTKKARTPTVLEYGGVRYSGGTEVPVRTVLPVAVRAA